MRYLNVSEVTTVVEVCGEVVVVHSRVVIVLARHRLSCSDLSVPPCEKSCHCIDFYSLPSHSIVSSNECRICNVARHHGGLRNRKQAQQILCKQSHSQAELWLHAIVTESLVM